MSSSNSNEAILATGGYDHTVKLWQAHTGMCYWTGQHVESQVNCLAISRDKSKLTAAGFQHIRLYDLNSENSNALINYEGITKNVTSVGFQDDNKWLFSASEDGTLRIWDLRCKTHRGCNTDAVINFAILHPNQCEIIFCDENGMIRVWNLKNDTRELIAQLDGNVLCVEIDSTRCYLAAVTNTGHFTLWKVTHENSFIASVNEERTILAHSKQILKCRFSPDSTTLVTTSVDQTARLWNVPDLSLKMELKCSNGMRWVWDAAFSDDSEYLITVSSDGIGRSWNLKTGAVEREYNGHQKAVVSLAFRDSSLT